MRRFGQPAQSQTPPGLSSSLPQDAGLDSFDADRAPSPTSIRGMSRRHSHSSINSAMRPPPRSPGEELTPFSSSGRMGALRSPTVNVRQMFYEELSRSPQAALIHPGFCQNPLQGVQLKAAFAHHRKNLSARYHQIIRDTIFQQFEDSVSSRPQADAEGCENPQGPPNVDDYERWHRARRSLTEESLFTVPSGRGRPMFQHFVNRSFRPVMLRHFHASIAPRAGAQGGRHRIELPRLTSESYSIAELQSITPHDLRGGFSWLASARLAKAELPSFNSQVFWPHSDPDSPDLAFYAWMFKGPLGVFFEHFGEICLQVRLEAARLSGIFSLEQLNDIFASSRLADIDEEAYASHLEIDKYEFIEAKRAYIIGLEQFAGVEETQELNLWEKISDAVYAQQDALADWHQVRAESMAKRVDCLIDIIAFLNAGALQVDQFDSAGRQSISLELAKHYNERIAEIENGQERTY